MEEKTIKDVLEALHDAMQKALPDMDVTINIQVGPKKKTTEQAETIAEEKTPSGNDSSQAAENDLACLKATLNGYVKAVGKTNTYELVKEFTGGTKNPADIPVERYPEVFTRMKKDGVEKINVDLSSKGKVSA